ncbi:MAG: hypothetical protein JNK65_07535, partial [Deltaproteobacteria bacterium]|nr:hypothetical protein [Deltaproteobacteria bacterium]
RALQNDPKKRYANASEFLTDLFEARHRLHLNLKPEAIAERVQRILYPYKFFDAGEVQTSESEPITNGTLVSARKNENINSENEDTRSLLENSKRVPWKLLTTGLFLVLGYLLYSTYFQKNSPSPLSSLSHQNQTSETFSAIAPPITESKKAESTKAENLSAKAETHSNVPIIKSSILPVSETKSAQQILEEKKKRDEKLKLEKLEKEKRLALKKEMEEKKLTEPSIKTVEKVENKKEEEAKAVTTSGQGSLFVKASPWGKISVSGVVSGSERPVSKMLSYGNYTVSVSYQNVEGQWKTVSRNVRIAKAATSCSANFRPDGTGGISCN